MRRDIEIYAERPKPLAAGEERWACGSGYLLSGRLVLTAAHVVCRGDVPLQKVWVRGEDEQLYLATVVWHRCEIGIDVALLEITDTSWAAPRWPRLVRYGRFVTGRAGAVVRGGWIPAGGGRASAA